MARSLVFPSILSLLLLASVARAGNIAAWYASKVGPGVIMQDTVSGNIMYSSCNSNSTPPVFPVESPNLLPWTKRPRNGTSLAAVGWLNGQSIRTASIFYQAEDGSIINAIYGCDISTGLYSQLESSPTTISETLNAPTPHSETGLSAELLGSSTGYRVFFHDTNRAIHMLWFTNSAKWVYGGVLSPQSASSKAIASLHSSGSNITVFYPQGDNIGAARQWSSDKNFHLSSFPQALAYGNYTNETSAQDISLDTNGPVNFTLPAWNGKPAVLGTTLDKLFTRSVFYIGTDKMLHQISNINYYWRLQPPQNEQTWPAADTPNAPLGAAYNSDSSEAWIYYVNGSLTQLYYGKDLLWHKAEVLPTSGAAAPKPTSSNDPPPTVPDTPQDAPAPAPTGLSNGAKVGIGIGVSLGVLALAGGLGIMAFLRRRRSRLEHDERAIGPGEMAPAYPGGPGYDGSYAHQQQGIPQQYSPAQISAMTATPPPTQPYSEFGNLQWSQDRKDGSMRATPQEMEQPRVLHELPQHNVTHEMG